MFFFFKQKTAYEMRISDWSSDVCSSDLTDLQFPIVADADLKIARMYDMIHPEQSETAAVRSVFIIDPNKKIRLTMTYPMSVGRNFDEILRVIDEIGRASCRERVCQYV